MSAMNLRQTGGVVLGTGMATGFSSQTAIAASSNVASARALGVRNFGSKSVGGYSSYGIAGRRSGIIAGGGVYGTKMSGATYFGSGAQGVYGSGGVLLGSSSVLASKAGLGVFGARGPGLSATGMPGAMYGAPGGRVPLGAVPGQGYPLGAVPGQGYPLGAVPGQGYPLGAFPGPGAPPISAAAINPVLLAPLDLTIDPTIQANRIQEKEQMKTLNNQFAGFINKVRLLEQQNKLLETKWLLLQEQTITRSNIDTMYEAYITNVRRQVDSLTAEKVKLDGELKNMQSVVDEYKTRFEEEINKRATVENEFVLLKKDVDTVYGTKVDLESQVDNLQDQLNFLRAVYEEELRELRSQITDTVAVVEMDTNRYVDMESLVKEVRAQYDEITTRSREETTAYYQAKIVEMEATSDRFTEDLRMTKVEMAEMTRSITRLQTEIESTKVANQSLEVHITDVRTRGEESITEAKQRLTELEEALMRAKQDVATQVRDYQELLNTKLGLDIEIATYRKLLEGEEIRLTTGSAATIHVQSAEGSYIVDSTGGGLASASGGRVAVGAGGLSVAMAGGVGGAVAAGAGGVGLAPRSFAMTTGAVPYGYGRSASSLYQVGGLGMGRLGVGGVGVGGVSVGGVSMAGASTGQIAMANTGSFARI